MMLILVNMLTFLVNITKILVINPKKFDIPKKDSQYKKSLVKPKFFQNPKIVRKKPKKFDITKKV